MHSCAVQVQFPDDTNTLCLLPAKFHKKLWIKRGNFLIIENMENSDAAVTGQILHVLFADDVKQLKKVEGVWPPEFAESASKAVDRSADLAATLEDLSIEERGKTSKTRDIEAEIPKKYIGAEEGISSSDDDNLPPLHRIENRRIITYDISDSESE